jgi:hypothetical protein
LELLFDPSSVTLSHVLARLPSLALIRLLVALLLATIGLQASEPFTGLERDRGSAFSASTTDVAIASFKTAATVRLHVAPVPVFPVKDLPTTLSVPVDVTAPAPRPASTGPPARVILVRQPAPRAPPSS